MTAIQATKTARPSVSRKVLGGLALVIVSAPIGFLLAWALDSNATSTTEPVVSAGYIQAMSA